MAGGWQVRVRQVDSLKGTTSTPVTLETNIKRAGPRGIEGPQGVGVPDATDEPAGILAESDGEGGWRKVGFVVIDHSGQHPRLQVYDSGGTLRGYLNSFPFSLESPADLDLKAHGGVGARFRSDVLSVNRNLAPWNKGTHTLGDKSDPWGGAYLYYRDVGDPPPAPGGRTLAIFAEDDGKNEIKALFSDGSTRPLTAPEDIEAPHVVTRTMARALATPVGNPALYPVYDYPVRDVAVNTDAYGMKLSSGHTWEHAPGEDIDGTVAQQQLNYTPQGTLEFREVEHPPSVTSPVGAAFSLVSDWTHTLEVDGQLEMGCKWVKRSTHNWLRGMCLAYVDNRNFLLAVHTSASLRIESVVGGMRTILADVGAVANGVRYQDALLDMRAAIYRTHPNSGGSWTVGLTQGYGGDRQSIETWAALPAAEEAAFVGVPVKVGLFAHRFAYAFSFWAGLGVYS